LILDEPTAVLTPQETHELFKAIQGFVAAGKTIIFITHKLREVKAIADHATVLRGGRVVATVRVAEVTEEYLAQLMVGRAVTLTVTKSPARPGAVVLEARDLSYVTPTGRWALRRVTFGVRSGEILGIAGIEGSGQTELVEILAGLLQPTGGGIWLNGQPLVARTPRQVREAGLSHIPEDRLKNGVAALASIADNLVVDRYYRPPLVRGGGWLDVRQIRRHATALMERFDIRAADPDIPVGALSGGNMQKVVVARELSSNPRALLAAQPTRGIDIGATEFVRQQLVEQRDRGAAILLVSADLAEVMQLSDRLAVMYSGEVVATFDTPQRLTEEEIGLYMLGVKRQMPHGVTVPA
ncbi:MAG: ABC transporter ATP-binding protein, partial [Chloroflexota bacterium]